MTYLQAWEGYWNSLKEAGVEAGWDVSPQKAAEVDFALFQPYFDPALPVIDLACGTGKQAIFLAEHFQRVIATDVSPTAIQRAEQENPHPNISYRVMDMLNMEAVAVLHDEVGDANIYMRSVLHQIKAEDRAAFARALELLLGQAGTLYLKEVKHEGVAYLQNFIRSSGLPPLEMKLMIQHGITPGVLPESELDTLFPAALIAGDGTMDMNYTKLDGEWAKIPALYRVIRAR